MKPKTELLAVYTCLFVSLILISSCKKENAQASNSGKTGNISAFSVDSLATGLIAWYTFDGDVLDHSGHNNNVIFNSAQPTKGKGGIAKTAYLFNGVSSYMEVANSTSLNPQKITLYAVIKAKGFYAGACHNNRIISKGYDDTQNGRYTLSFSDQLFYNYNGCNDSVATRYENFGAEFGDGQVTATGVVDGLDYIKVNKWYDVAYTFDGTYSRLYVNGVLRAQAMKATTFSANTQDVFFGRNEGVSYPYYFNGVIDEIRIYKRALSAKEVSALSN